MGSAKRAFLYLNRKRSKSILLFVILLALTTLVMTVVSIGNATRESAAQLRRTLGGYFKLEDNLNYSGQREAITDSLINQICTINGNKASNRMNIEYLISPNLTLQAGRFTAEGDEKAHLARFLGNTDSSLHEYFVLHSLKLVEGRHIQSNDQGKAIISKEVAKLNGLNIGDTLSAELYLEDMNSGIPADFHPYHWEIVGIFDLNTVNESNSMTAECDMVNNFIFSDISSMMNVQTIINAQSAGKYREASFFVDDPGQLDTIIDKVYEIEGVNWDTFELNINDKAYQNAVVPLNRLGSYTGLFLLVVIVISVVLLSLILTMWMRDRLWEIGVFLSIGIKKTSLVRQHIIEVLLLLLLALIVAFPVSNAVADHVGKSLLETISREEVNQEENSFELFYDPVQLSYETENPKAVEISVDANEFLFVALYGVSVSLIAVGLSSIMIMRLKPKDILSAMS